MAVGPGHRLRINMTPFPPKSWTWLLSGVKAYHRSTFCASWAKASLFTPHPPSSLLFILCTCPVPFFLYLCNLDHVAVPYSQSPLSLCHQREIFPICSFTVYEKKKLSVFVYTRVWATMSTTIKQIHCFQRCGRFFRQASPEEEFTHCWCSISLHLHRSRTTVVSLGCLVQKPQKSQTREEAAGDLVQLVEWLLTNPDKWGAVLKRTQLYHLCLKSLNRPSDQWRTTVRYHLETRFLSMFTGSSTP